MSSSSTLALPAYATGDEIASSVIHGLGIALSIAGLAILVAFAALVGNALTVVACAVFGTSLVMLYTASTLYHSVTVPVARHWLRKADHAAIYLLIAGTYTPFALVALAGPTGWSLFGAVWGLALVGMALEVGAFARWRKWSVALYVAIGWIGMMLFGPLHAYLHTGGTALLLAGGLAYTAGVPFYLWHRLPYHHALWHVFVLAGSVLHFLAVVLYVIPTVGSSI
ncbi:MAG TPA: hemolysin III family protein [Rhodanobacteraceae bacterium]